MSAAYCAPCALAQRGVIWHVHAVRRLISSFAVSFALLSGALLTTTDAEAWPLDHLLDPSDIGQNKIPNKGQASILIIPVNVGPQPFPDLTGLQAEYNPAGGPGTFREQWQIFSRGVYDPIPTLVDVVEYPDSCPMPAQFGYDVDNCEFDLTAYGDSQMVINFVVNGGIALTLQNILGRIRDEQNIDLNDFDVSGATEGTPDGYFDGVIVISDLTAGGGSNGRGVAPPLEELFNKTVVKALPGDMGNDLELGQVAFAPPPNHEFGHLFGFIDLYNGPTAAGLMGTVQAGGLSAFSRQQIGWGETTIIDGFTEVDLPPVLESGEILRVGASGGKYLLIENRGGPLHDMHEVISPGIYVYAVDESAITPGPLHFFDLVAGDLHYPNGGPPFLSVATPLSCDVMTTRPNPCAMTDVGEFRTLQHADGTTYDMALEIKSINPDNSVTLEFKSPTIGGPGSNGAPAAVAVRAVRPPTRTRRATTVVVDARCLAATGDRAMRGARHYLQLVLLLAGIALTRRRQQRVR